MDSKTKMPPGFRVSLDDLKPGAADLDNIYGQIEKCLERMDGRPIKGFVFIALGGRNPDDTELKIASTSSMDADIEEMVAMHEAIIIAGDRFAQHFADTRCWKEEEDAPAGKEN